MHRKLRYCLRCIFRDGYVSYKDFLPQARSIQREIQDEKALDSKFPSSAKTKSKLPPRLELHQSYSDSPPSSTKIAISIIHDTDRTITIPKGTKASGIFTGNKMPKIKNQAVKVSKLQKDLENCKATNSNSNPCASTNPTCHSQTSEPKETCGWILEKLYLSGMEEWCTDLQGNAKSLLMSYADIFSKDDLDIGTTHVVKHYIFYNR